MKFIYDIIALIIGHITVFKHSFKKRVTRKYPEIKQTLPDRFRGKPIWSASECIACKLCEKVCPAGALCITKEADNNIKFQLNLEKCIFCGNCAYNCPKKSISMSKEYELATDKKSSLYIEINSLNSTLKDT